MQVLRSAPTEEFPQGEILVQHSKEFRTVINPETGKWMRLDGIDGWKEKDKPLEYVGAYITWKSNGVHPNGVAKPRTRRELRCPPGPLPSPPPPPGALDRLKGGIGAIGSAIGSGVKAFFGAIKSGVLVLKRDALSAADSAVDSVKEDGLGAFTSIPGKLSAKLDDWTNDPYARFDDFDLNEFSLTFLDVVLSHKPVEWSKFWGKRNLLPKLGGAGITAQIELRNSAFLRIGLFGGGFGVDLFNQASIEAELLRKRMRMLFIEFTFKFTRCAYYHLVSS